MAAKMQIMISTFLLLSAVAVASAVTVRHSPGGGTNKTTLKCGKTIENESGNPVAIGCCCDAIEGWAYSSNPADWFMTPVGPATHLSLFTNILCREVLSEAGQPTVSCYSDTDCNGGQSPAAWRFQGFCPVVIIPMIIGNQEWPPY